MTKNEILERVWEYIKANYIFGTQEIEEDSSFFDIGILDSTGIMELVVYIESSFNIRMPEDDIIRENLDSILHIVNYIYKNQESDRLMTSDTGYNMQLFPNAGKHNTIPLLDKLKKEAKEMTKAVTNILISSTTGYTYEEYLLHGLCEEIPVTVFCQDISKEYSMTDTMREKIRASAIRLMDVPKQYLQKKYSSDVTRILRCFSEGTKVCVEIVEFAIEQKVVAQGDIVVAIAGTLKGADTCIVFEILNENRYNVLKIMAIPKER